MTLIIDGTIVPGLGGATSSLSVQLPIFKWHHPELGVCRAGTVNVRLDEAFRINEPDFSIGPIRYDNGWVESYGFVGATIEVPIGIAARPIWIYLPDRSPHRNDLFLVEIIGPQIDGAITGHRCRLAIKRDFKRVGINVIG